MGERKLLSIDGNVEIDVCRTEPTSTLANGAYRVRLTIHDPEQERRLITLDPDGFAELLTGILADDDSLRTAVRQALFTRHGKVVEDLPPTAYR